MTQEEQFNGRVERIGDGIAFSTLKNEQEELWAEFPLSEYPELAEAEGRQFTCLFSKSGVVITLIPLIEITAEEHEEIRKEVRIALGDEPQDDY